MSPKLDIEQLNSVLQSSVQSAPPLFAGYVASMAQKFVFSLGPSPGSGALTDGQKLAYFDNLNRLALAVKNGEEPPEWSIPEN